MRKKIQKLSEYCANDANMIKWMWVELTSSIGLAKYLANIANICKPFPQRIWEYSDANIIKWMWVDLTSSIGLATSLSTRLLCSSLWPYRREKHIKLMILVRRADLWWSLWPNTREKHSQKSPYRRKDTLIADLCRTC